MEHTTSNPDFESASRTLSATGSGYEGWLESFGEDSVCCRCRKDEVVES